jgi:uncharacterized RDD family membrane protein YckC
MLNQQILDYIKECRNRNISDQEIILKLKESGWDDARINEAFNYINANQTTLNLQPSNQTLNTQSTTSIKPAGAWGRFWAFFIDGIIFGIFVIAVSIFLSIILKSAIPATGNIINNIIAPNAFLLALITLPLYLSYFIYFTSKKGATIGKDMYGFKVYKYKTDELLSFPTAIKREIFKFFYLLPLIGSVIYIIVGLTIIFSKEKRGLPDHFAGTQVLAINKAWSLKKTIFCFFNTIYRSYS